MSEKRRWEWKGIREEREGRGGEREGKETRARLITGTTDLSELVTFSRTYCQYF